MKPFVGKTLLVLALMAPGSLLPAFQDHDRDHDRDKQSQRYYDSKSKDWHDWNDHEKESYDRYRRDNHRPDRDFSKLSKKEQQEYFRWQHEHADEHHR